MLCNWTHKITLTIILDKKWIGIKESLSQVGDIFLADYVIEKNNYNHASEGELDCEDVIMNEKERFGRVRTSMMKTLRKKYGRETADRALSRINKRLSEDSLRIKNNLEQPTYSI